MQEQNKTIGRYFLESRKKNGLKRQDLYSLCGIKKIEIFDIEMSKTIPSKGTISILCKALGLDEALCFEMARLERENIIKNYYSSSFGKLIENARKANGMTLKEVAYVLEIHEGTLRRTESDQTVPRKSLFESFVSLFDLDRKKALAAFKRCRSNRASAKTMNVTNKNDYSDVQATTTKDDLTTTKKTKVIKNIDSKSEESSKIVSGKMLSGKMLSVIFSSHAISPEIASEKLGVSLSELYEFFGGKKTPTEEFVIRAAETFRFSPIKILEEIRKEWLIHFNKIKEKGNKNVLKTAPIYCIALRSSRILNGLSVNGISNSIGYSHNYPAILEDGRILLKEDRIFCASKAWHVDPDVLRELWVRHASLQRSTQIAGDLRDKLHSLSAEAAREIFEVLKKHLGS